MKLEDITSFEEKHKYLEENLQDDMYVRTSDNGIDKFKFKFKLKNDGNPFYIYYFEKTSMTNPERYIVKEPSHNIIDLIEEGDYVNGWKILHWTDGTKIVDDGWATDLDKMDIKSIVTKEQMEAMEYKIV